MHPSHEIAHVTCAYFNTFRLAGRTRRKNNVLRVFALNPLCSFLPHKSFKSVFAGRGFILRVDAFVVVLSVTSMNRINSMHRAQFVCIIYMLASQLLRNLFWQRKRCNNVRVVYLLVDVKNARCRQFRIYRYKGMSAAQAGQKAGYHQRRFVAIYDVGRTRGAAIAGGIRATCRVISAVCGLVVAWRFRSVLVAFPRLCLVGATGVTNCSSSFGTKSPTSRVAFFQTHKPRLKGKCAVFFTGKVMGTLRAFLLLNGIFDTARKTPNFAVTKRLIVDAIRNPRWLFQRISCNRVQKFMC